MNLLNNTIDSLNITFNKKNLVQFTTNGLITAKYKAKSLNQSIQALARKSTQHMVPEDMAILIGSDLFN